MNDVVHGLDAAVCERRWCYPTAMATVRGNQGLRDALDWVRGTSRRVGGTPLLRLPTTVSSDSTVRAFVADHRAVLTTTAADPVPDGWHGVVLAVWPERDDLIDLADDPRTAGLCVVPLELVDVGAWATLTRPELLGQSMTPRPPTAVTPVTDQALRTLSRLVCHPVTLTSAPDCRDATAILDILRAAHQPFTAESLYAWALANGWRAVGAARLAELADDHGHRGTPDPRGHNPFDPAVVDLWRARAARGVW
ncbi:hypothetical protein [Nocardia bovistercoris]|uniref:Uncharacterized protein n=1 Tax=Nocardia bovistercoris TaxID=2785916 RepID=A0A931IAC7_9NOCA|nr:hypothetical protein [Nocardia bovistercoris]MBH0777779.1 hypothetical protein [Nocardia bovistercoris]